MNYLITLLAGLVVTATNVQANTFTVKDAAQTVQLVGVVNGKSLAIAQQIEKLSREGKDIDILINSPGGSVAVGMTIVDAIKTAQARGSSIRCVSVVMAASMGFTILAECDERYVMANTRLLFHPISISTPRSRVQELAIDLAETVAEERLIMKRLQTKLGLSWRDFHRHYFTETFWAGRRLATFTARARFLKLVTDVRGFGDNTFKYLQPTPFLFLVPTDTKQIIERFERGE